MTAPLDEHALASLIRVHTPQLLGVVLSFTTLDAEAEDILQEVWMIAAEKAHRRPRGAPLGAWLHAVALNRARSHCRRARRRRWLATLWSAELPAAHDDTRAPSLPSELQRARLWRAVAGLPRLQRDAVLLRVVEGLSTREAAQRLGRAEGTVKASLHRGLSTLRRLLDASPKERSDD